MQEMEREMDESTMAAPGADEAAGDRGQERPEPDTAWTAWRSEGPDALFNHYRQRRLLALGVLPESAA